MFVVVNRMEMEMLASVGITKISCARMTPRITLKLKLKRWDDMEACPVVEERQKISPDELLQVVMNHVRRWFVGEYKEWEKYGTSTDDRRYTLDTL
jgi:hypothetical protein